MKCNRLVIKNKTKSGNLAKTYYYLFENGQLDIVRYILVNNDIKDASIELEDYCLIKTFKDKLMYRITIGFIKQTVLDLIYFYLKSSNIHSIEIDGKGLKLGILKS